MLSPPCICTIGIFKKRDEIAKEIASNLSPNIITKSGFILLSSWVYFTTPNPVALEIFKEK